MEGTLWSTKLVEIPLNFLFYQKLVITANALYCLLFIVRMESLLLCCCVCFQ